MDTLLSPPPLPQARTRVGTTLIYPTSGLGSHPFRCSCGDQALQRPAVLIVLGVGTGALWAVAFFGLGFYGKDVGSNGGKSRCT